MEPTGGDVGEFVAAVSPAVRQRDAGTLISLMRRVTGQEPVLWGSIIGFGRYHYAYDSGREGDAGAAGFAPRKAATVVYLPDGTRAHADALAHLGPHTTGLVCLYLKNLDDVDLAVLEEIVRTSYAAVTSGVFTRRAGQDGTDPGAVPSE
jgi:hypothetical protein